MLGLFGESMILLKKEKKIILTPAKCGSSTLDYIFTESPNSNGIKYHGPQFGLPHIEKHTNVLPYEIQNRYANKGETGTIGIAVRNPYTRALSIYNHYLRYDKPEEGINSFTDFVKYRLVVGGHYFSQTLYEFCRRIQFPICQRNTGDIFWPNYIIHLETLEEDIGGFGYHFETVPTLNSTPDDTSYATMNDYTPEAIQAVRTWGEMDFSCFGYYHNFDKCHLVREKTKGLYVVPPEEFMSPYGDASFFIYLNSGKNSFSEIKKNLFKISNIDIDDQKKVLDFGCGAGRVIRNFDTDKEVYGVDVRKDVVDWCKENLPYEFHTNNSNLPFEKDYFDFILALSVFPHIGDIEEWATELTRTLSEGGTLYLSIIDEEAVSKMCKMKLDWCKDIDLDGFIAGKYPVLWDGYFSFVQRDHFLSLFPSSMELLGIGNSETFQTAYIFRKNAQQ